MIDPILICEIETSKLLEAITMANSIVNKKSPAAVAINVQLIFSNQNLQIISTNLESILLQTLNIQSLYDCKRLVKIEVLNDVLKKAAKQIKLFYTEKELIIKDSIGSTSLFHSTDIFPMRNIETFKEFFSLPGEVLNDLIKNTNINVSLDEGGNFCLDFKPNIISCILHERHRMAVAVTSIPHLLTKKLFFNPKIRKFFMNVHGPVTFYIKDNEFLFKTEKTSIISRFVEGTFLNYQEIIDQRLKYFKFTCNKKELVNGTSRVLTLSSLITKSIKLTFSKESVLLESRDPTIGYSSLTIAGTGDFDTTTIININGEYLIDSLKCESENKEICIFLQKNGRYFILESGGWHVIMPIHV